MRAHCLPDALVIKKEGGRSNASAICNVVGRVSEDPRAVYVLLPVLGILLGVLLLVDVLLVQSVVVWNG